MSAENSYIAYMNNWEGFLKAHPNNFLRFQKIINGNAINDHLKFKPSGPGNTYLKWKDVQASGKNTLAEYFDAYLKANDVPELLVTFLRTSGNASRFDKSQKQYLRINFSNRKNALLKPAEATPIIQEPKATETVIEQPTVAAPPIAAPTIQTPMAYQHNDFEKAALMSRGGLGAAAIAAGMGTRDLLDVEKKAEMSDFYKEQYEHYKKKWDELDIQNRSLQAKLETAEKQKEIAVKETQLASKSWSDPENIASLFQNAGPVVQAIIANKQGAAPAQTGMGSAQGLSEDKQRFIEYMSDPSFTDEKSVLLESALVAMTQVAGFEEQIKALIQKSLSNEPSGS